MVFFPVSPFSSCKRVGIDPLTPGATQRPMDAQLLVCYACSNMLVGKVCQAHHVSLCHKSTWRAWKWYNPMAKSTPRDSHLRWIDCCMCDLQLKYAGKELLQITATSRWVRLTVRLFQRRTAMAKLRMLCNSPVWPEHITSSVLALAA